MTTDNVGLFQVEVGRGTFNGETYEPAHTQAEAEAACRALGWELVEAVDADCAVWLVQITSEDARRLARNEWLLVARNGYYGQCELP